jgi:hypothetical protein
MQYSDKAARPTIHHRGTLRGPKRHGQDATATIRPEDGRPYRTRALFLVPVSRRRQLLLPDIAGSASELDGDDPWPAQALQ